MRAPSPGCSTSGGAVKTSFTCAGSAIITNGGVRQEADREALAVLRATPLEERRSGAHQAIVCSADGRRGPGGRLGVTVTSLTPTAEPRLDGEARSVPMRTHPPPAAPPARPRGSPRRTPAGDPFVLIGVSPSAAGRPPTSSSGCDVVENAWGEGRLMRSSPQLAPTVRGLVDPLRRACQPLDGPEAHRAEPAGGPLRRDAGDPGAHVSSSAG